MTKHLNLFMALAAVVTCYSDSGCGNGLFCVFPEGATVTRGVCAKPPIGANPEWGSNKPRQVGSCVSDASCQAGSKCIKDDGWVEGVCTR